MSAGEPKTKAHDHHLYLVDGSGYIFRAFHALPPMTRPDGTPVNAVLGFTNMLIKLLADTEAEGIAVIFDTARTLVPQRNLSRLQGQPPGPAGGADPAVRPDPRGDARFQRAVRRARELRGRRPDRDLRAPRARARGLEVTIVSSDKDLMQLVGEGVAMFDPMKNRSIGPGRGG